MDVRLPDGTVIKNVPEGTTKAQLTEKLQKNGYDISKLSLQQPRQNVSAEPGTLTESIKTAPGRGLDMYKNLQLGLLGGVADVGATIMTPVDVAARAMGIQNDVVGRSDRREAIQQALQTLGVNPESGAAQAGKAVGQGIGAAPYTAALGQGVIAAGAPALGRAIQMGGFGKGNAGEGTVNAVKNYLTSILGGAAAGGAGGYLAEPEQQNALVGAGIGAAIPAAGKIAIGGIDLGGRYANSAYESLLKSMGTNPDEVMNAIRNFKSGVTGEVPHVGEQAVAAQNPKFSALVQDMVQKYAGEGLANLDARNAVARELYQQGVAKDVDSALSLVNDSIGTAENLAVPSTELAKKTEGAVEFTGKRVREAGPTPLLSVDQKEMGDIVSAEHAKLVKQNKQEASDQYERAKKLAPKPFDVQAVKNAANDITQENSPYATKLIPDTVDALRKIPQGALDVARNVRHPATATMDSMIEAVNAINREYAALKGVPEAAKERSILNNIRSAIIDTVNKNAPVDAAKAFEQGRSTYQTKVAEPYFTGEFSKLGRTNATDEQQLLSSNVGNTILKNEDMADRFLNAFGKGEARSDKSPEAIAAARKSILSLYNEQVAKNGIVDPAKHKAFINEYKHVINRLDQGSDMGLADTLSKTGKKAVARQQATDVNAAIKKEADQLGFRTPEDMRSAFLNDPKKLDLGLKYVVSPEGRQGLARGMVDDVLAAGKDKIANAVSKNQESLRTALEAAHPGQADAIIRQLKDFGNAYDTVLEGQNLLGKFAGSENIVGQNLNRAAVQKEVEQLTKNLSPDAKRELDAIRKSYENQQSFLELAKKGNVKAASGTENIMQETINEPKMLSGFRYFVREIADRIGREISGDQAAKVAKAMLKPDDFEAVVKDALKYRQSLQQTVEKGGMLGKGVSATAVPAVNEAVSSKDRNKLRSQR